MAEEQAMTPAPAPERKLRRTANTVREYETIYLVQADLAPEALDRIKERVRSVVQANGGRVVKFTTWGRKKTAFPVGKQMRAIFVHVDYIGEGKAVSELERNLRNLEEVAKYQTIKIADAVNPEARPTEQDVVLEGDREEERPPREAREELHGEEGGPEEQDEGEGRGEDEEEKE
jgi:small subunit ribosomal protein S6